MAHNVALFVTCLVDLFRPSIAFAAIKLIEEGRIAIDGKPVEKPATLLSSLHGVTVDGNPVKAPAPARLFRYHKPAGLLTAERDAEAGDQVVPHHPAGGAEPEEPIPRAEVVVERMDLQVLEQDPAVALDDRLRQAGGPR